jgi:hypothetical protein
VRERRLPRNDARRISARKYSLSPWILGVRWSWRQSGQNAGRGLAACRPSRWAACDRLQAACHDRDTRASSTAHRHILMIACSTGQWLWPAGTMPPPCCCLLSSAFVCFPLQAASSRPALRTIWRGTWAAALCIALAPLSTFHFPLCTLHLVPFRLLVAQTINASNLARSCSSAALCSPCRHLAVVLTPSCPCHGFVDSTQSAPWLQLVRRPLTAGCRPFS